MIFFRSALEDKGPLVFFLLAFLYCNHAFADGGYSQLPEPVRKIMKKYKLPEDSLSFHVQEYDSAQALIAINIDTSRNPASVIKLLTTYAGLTLLGPNYRWRTSVYLDGKLTNGTLDGDLIIAGGGDPFLSIETFWHLLFTLRNRGLKYINGNLLIDDGHFENETGSPADFDNKPHHVYNAFPDAALLNFSAHQFHFIPMDKSVHIYADPPASNLVISNKLKLGYGPCQGKHNQIRFNVVNRHSINTVEFSGDYPKNCGNQGLLRTVLSHDDYLFGVFKALWQDLGGTIYGHIDKTSIDEATKPFYTLPSRPLGEIISYINKYSNNVMVRQLLLTIGQEKLNTIGSKSAGRKVIRDWLDNIGISAPELILENGSGLSRKTRISARTLTKLLRHALASPYQPEFFASLPLVGVDGTVRKRLNGKIPEGNARIKTGVINNVRAMAGYVKSKNNKYYTIVSLQNYKGIHNTLGTLVQDKMLEWLYEQ